LRVYGAFTLGVNTHIPLFNA